MAKGLFGGRIVGWRYLGRVPSYMAIAYEMDYRGAYVMYPKPLHIVVRYWRRFYWGFLGSCYWAGLIDTKIGEEFRWSDFWRIRVNRR